MGLKNGFFFRGAPGCGAPPPARKSAWNKDHCILHQLCMVEVFVQPAAPTDQPALRQLLEDHIHNEVSGCGMPHP